MMLLSVCTVWMTLSSLKADSLDFVLVPVTTDDSIVNVYLEIQTYDISTTGRVDLQIYISTRHLSESFTNIADVRYEFNLLPAEIPSYGKLMENAIHINLAGINLVNAVTIKARFNDMSPMIIYPIRNLGKKYKIITYCQILGSCHIGFAGLKDASTNVSIVLPNNYAIIDDSDMVKYENDSIHVQLSSGRSMLFECVGCDLTNTMITSTGPIAVFAGGRTTVVRKGIKESTFMTQIPQIQTWGKTFLLSSSDADEGGDIIRIISRFRKTNIHIEGSKTIQIKNTKQFVQRLIPKGSLLRLTANKPIMVCQLLYNGVNHAAMLNIPPTEQFLPYSFAFPCNQNVTLLFHGNSANTLSVNGTERTSFYISSNSGYVASNFVGNGNGANAICDITDDGSAFGILLRTIREPGNSLLDFQYNSGAFLQEIKVSPKKQMIPGDLVDNDGDGGIDEDDCSLTDEIYYGSELRNFNESTEECAARNMELATLHTKERYDKALEYISTNGVIINKPIYIGLSKSNESGGEYVWIDGTLATFFKWSANHSTNTNNETNCVVLSTDLETFGLFIENDCEEDVAYLCTVWAELDGKDCMGTTSESKDHKGILFLFPVWYLSIIGSADRGTVNIDLSAELESNSEVLVTKFLQGAPVYDAHERHTASFSSNLVLDVGFPDAMTVIKAESMSTEFSLHMILHQNMNGIKKSMSTILYPYDTWSLEYFAASYCTVDCVSFCFITTASYNTNVNIVLKKMSMKIDVIMMETTFAVENKLTFSMILDRYMYAMLKSTQDLTGTYIKGDNPISVICGSDFSNFIIGEQLPPVNLYNEGSFSYIFQLYGTGQQNMIYIIRVMTSESNTLCNINSNLASQQTWRLNHTGDFLEHYIMGVTELLTITCDRAVLVWNIVIRGDETGTMTIVPANSQYYTEQNWFTPDVTNDVIQNLYLYITSRNFPFIHNSKKWYDQKGFVTTMTEITSFDATTTHKNISFFLWNIGHDNGYAFGTPLAMPFIEQQVCELGSTTDEDCDGRVDEELCTLLGYNFLPEKYLLEPGKYLPDYDFDGNYDEDCAYIIPNCYQPSLNFTNINDFTSDSDTYVTSVFRSFTCHDGYSVINETSEIICYADGMWKPDIICIKDCPDPRTNYSDSVIVNATFWKVGEYAIMGCEDGFTLLGSDVINCTENSTWTADVFRCAADCQDPTTEYPDSIIVNATSWKVGEYAVMDCKEGFTLIGSNVTKCTENSTWTADVFHCAADCGNPSSLVQHSQMMNPAGMSTFPVLNTYRMTCTSGYSVSGNASMKCQENSTWSQPMFTCVTGCNDPRLSTPYAYIINHVDGTPFIPDTTINMDCTWATTRVGNGQMICQFDGKWDSSITCIPDCGDPRSTIQVANASLAGFTDSSIVAFNTTYTFQCNSMYSMVGSGAISCNHNSIWSQPSFYCIACICECSTVGTPRYTNQELTPDIISLIKSETKQKLSVDDKTLSAYIRTKISAPNKKQSERSIGYVGAIFFVVVLGSLVALDIPTLHRHIKHLIKTMKSFYKRFSKWKYKTFSV